MHHDCLEPIVHRDISSKNILLNAEYEACVSDFGTAKFLNPDSANWTALAGTYGYIAPGNFVFSVLYIDHFFMRLFFYGYSLFFFILFFSF
jgi:serine/threonine protein kinase